MEIEEFDDFIEQLVNLISIHQKKEIERELVFNALFMVYGDKQGLDHPVNVWDIDVSFDEAFESLKKFDFDIFLTPIQIDIDFDRDELFGTKAKIKAAGFQVVIHRYDKDPFPSNPHGHICGQNIKIDLRNGKCYRNRDFVRKLRKKKLLELRQKATFNFKGDLPPLEI